MIIDHRIYHIQPGKLDAAIEMYRTLGYQAQTEYLGKPFAFMRSVPGAPDLYVHMWIYKNEEDRLKKRESLQADARWKKYVHDLHEAGYLLLQETQLLHPTDLASTPAS